MSYNFEYKHLKLIFTYKRNCNTVPNKVKINKIQAFSILERMDVEIFWPLLNNYYSTLSLSCLLGL